MLGWVVAGSVKFAINSLRARGLAWRQIGYGGMPSTHSTIVSTTAVLVGLREGWNSAAFSVAAALSLIVMLDAMSLRAKIGEHARLLNQLRAGEPATRPLREKLGHHWSEVVVGALLGAGCAVALNSLGG
jgi:acid phosphatase family membrane protein YuiD